MPETCPKCGATINDETVNCPDCQAPVKILRLEARVKMLEGVITDMEFMLGTKIVEHPSDPEHIKEAIDNYYPVDTHKYQEPEEPVDTLDDEAIVEHAKKNAQAFKEQIDRVFGEV